jgi:hypothetical protein
MYVRSMFEAMSVPTLPTGQKKSNAKLMLMLMPMPVPMLS